jgi:hypothetical protein
MTAPTTPKLIEVLGEAFADGPYAKTSIVRIERRPHDYASSFILEQLLVEFADGRTLPLVFKDLGTESVTDEARGVKPKFILNSSRELIVYRDILAMHKLGTAKCWAAISQPKRQIYWLFLEAVPGKELYQYGELDVWKLAARRLAAMHRAFDDRAIHLNTKVLVELRNFTRLYYQRWMERALRFAQAHRSPDELKQLARLSANYERVIERVQSLPRGLIHGEFYASNVIVDLSTSDGRVCPVDWEMAAIGPRSLDVAALIVGKWSAKESRAIAQAYLDEMNRASSHPIDEAEFHAGVELCRLVMAVQWLGWSEDWKPPAQHAFDWFGEATSLMDNGQWTMDNGKA